MTPAAITALPALQQLQELRDFRWLEPAYKQDRDHPCADAAATLAQLAHLTQLTHITLGRAEASIGTLITSVTGLTNLQSFTMESVHPLDPGDGFPTANPEVKWKVLSSGRLSQLLTSCSQLTTLSMEEVVLDQAGLDLLLAHPHIVNVTFLAIAATESRVDSPCSWQSLKLAMEVDIRTVAYVPLHSLEQPLAVTSLLLPPDVPSEQLPQLLLKATTRIAEHRRLFRIEDADWLCLKDYVSELASGEAVGWGGPVQAAFSPTAQSALFAALEPLAGVTGIVGLEFSLHFKNSPTGPPPRLSIGKPDLEALNRTWGSRVTSLWFRGVTAAPGFLKALETCFPKLGRLWLESAERDQQGLVAQIMLFCQRMTRPLTVYLDMDTHA
jgi:hypothetical protein